MNNNIVNNKEYYHALNFLKTIAIILIFNSHCDVLYPEKIRFLATGGAVGNCLFFILAGYFLKTDGEFHSFIIHKLNRLYPITLLSALIYVFIKPDIPQSIISFITTFFWPTYLWFIGALIVFYVISYYLFNQDLSNNFRLFTVIIFFIYVLYYIFLVDKSFWSVETKGITSVAGFFKLIYYFYLFCYGSYVKRNKIILNVSSKKSIILAISFFILSLFTKLLLQKGLIPMSFQFVSQLFGMFVAIFGLDYAIKIEDKYLSIIKGLIKVPDFLGQYALSINLAQLVVIEKTQNIIFPINIFCAFVISVLYAYALEKTVDLIFRIINIKKKNIRN